ncbi:hypothetical protein [Leifsonia xyli]|uniref:hypothetical protein n=1 Tax=Leifsonia xyli TaxID=1575 RepID=UPI003D675FD4
MSQNPQERPEPPSFPAVNRSPAVPPAGEASGGGERPPMTRREARAAREAEERAQAGAPEEHKEPQGPEEPQAPAQPVSAAVSPSAAGWSLNDGSPISSPTPTQESPADVAALAGLDFDAVVTGPVAQVEEPQPVGSQPGTVSTSGRTRITTILRVLSSECWTPMTRQPRTSTPSSGGSRTTCPTRSPRRSAAG